MRRPAWLRPLVLALLAAAGPAAAQQLPHLPTTRGIRFQGELATEGEFYSNSNVRLRRPGETGRLYANLTASMFGSLTVGVNLTLSTEDGANAGYGGLPGRQRVSAFGLHPQWAWGKGHLGSFTDSYTRFTYNGVRVTGAAFDINPGLLRLGAFGGRSDRAVSGGITTGSYNRNIFGGRVGVGRKSLWQPSTYFDVIVVRTWDDATSLPPPVDTTLAPNSPLEAATNQLVVTPQENLVASTVGGLSLLDKKINLRSEWAISAHTLDRRATPLADSVADDYPGFLRSLIEPRVGSHVDHAFSTDLQLRLPRLPGATPQSPRTLTATLGYRYVGPGYVSLGAASLLNDIREYRLRTTLRFRLWSLSLDGMRQADNLLDQKLNTTTRYRGGAVFTARASQRWMMSYRANRLTMGNGASDSTAWLDYGSTTLGTTQTLNFGSKHLLESASLDFNWQRAGDANPLRTSSDFVSSAVNLRAQFRASPNLRLAPSIGITAFRAGPEERKTRATFAGSGTWTTWQRRLTTTATLANTRYRGTNSLTGSVSSRLRVGPVDQLSVRFQTSFYRDRITRINGYDEALLSIRWTRTLGGGL